MYVLDEALLRDLVESPPDLSAWDVKVRAASLYFELPRNLLWAVVDEGAPPEPVEGVFVRLGDEGQADLLMVLGVRAERPGFSTASVLADLGDARGLDVPDGFHSDIPGAELAELYSVRSSSELLVLVARVLWYLDAYAEALEAVKGAGGEGPESPDHGGATSLDHHRVRLVERSRG
jgi:hypothetical protein